MTVDYIRRTVVRFNRHPVFGKRDPGEENPIFNDPMVLIGIDNLSENLPNAAATDTTPRTPSGFSIRLPFSSVTRKFL